MILAIDPGKVTGVAFLTMEGILSDMSQIKLSDIHKFLDSLTPDINVMVVENFRIRPNMNFTWQEMDTIKVIGMVEYRASQLRAALVKQEPSCYKIGAKWAGVEIPKNHDISHQVVAYAHGTFYSHKKLGNIIPAARIKK